MVLVAALLPSLSFLSALVLAIVTNSLDPALELGVSDTFFSGLIVAMSGGLTGLFGGGLAKIRGWNLVVPLMAALIIGLATFVAFAAFGLGTEVDNHFGSLATIWIGQAAGIILATRVAGLTLAGAVGVLVAVGIGAAAAIGAVPEKPAEVLLILGGLHLRRPARRRMLGCRGTLAIRRGLTPCSPRACRNCRPSHRVGVNRPARGHRGGKRLCLRVGKPP